MHHNLEIRHFLGRKSLPDNLIHKQDAGLRVVYQIVYVSWLEFMENGDGNCAVSDCCKETHTPVSLVAGADGYLITLFEAALLKGNVELCNPERHLTVCQGHSLVVGEGRTVPVADKAFLQCFVY